MQPSKMEPKGMRVEQNSRPARLALRFVAGVLLTMAVALGLFYLLMSPGQNDLGLMALFLTITSIITLLAGYLAYRSGWISRAPSLRWALLATYILASALTFFNVWITARLMFVNQHDLILATILLLFASGLAVALGSFFADALSTRIQKLRRAVQAVGQDGLDARADISGEDEIAELAQVFNHMAEQLQSSARKRRELEAYRRDLVAWVSHDLQTPLASIRAVLEALADDVVEDAATRKRYLHTAERDVRALSNLIDDLFQLAQIDAGGIQLEIASNSLADLISDSLESFSALAHEKGITLQGEVQGQVDPVRMDAHRIGRVLSNLISNALRHTPAGGEIRVVARALGDKVEVKVRDTGEGLAQQDLDRLFERFYRGEHSRSRSTGGVGLGLAIAKGFVEAHGGAIYAKQNFEQGASFVFELPHTSHPST